MYRIYIRDNNTPQFNYSTPVVKYLNHPLIPDEYDCRVGTGYINSLGDDFGEGEEYQLAVF